MTSILIVEDDKTVRETLALNLRAEGYEVLAADDGESGLRAARESRPDLVVLDVMLPKLDGLTVCRILRRESEMPIILLTARGTEADKIIGLETGADDYIVKPFSLGEFWRGAGRAAEAVRHGALAGWSPAISSGSAGRRAYRGEEEIAFALREFDLLAMLMRNRGAVLTASCCWPECGAKTSRATRARWMCISAGFARRSRRMLPTRRGSPRCAASGTGSRLELWKPC
jgi:DNA-binding response OmpR family regulator